VPDAAAVHQRHPVAPLRLIHVWGSNDEGQTAPDQVVQDLPQLRLSGTKGSLGLADPRQRFSFRQGDSGLSGIDLPLHGDHAGLCCGDLLPGRMQGMCSLLKLGLDLVRGQRSNEGAAFQQVTLADRQVHDLAPNLGPHGGLIAFNTAVNLKDARQGWRGPPRYPEPQQQEPEAHQY
jgi:hypothetical protein